MTDNKIVQNYTIQSNPLEALSNEEIQGLLSIASAIYEASPVNVDIKEGTISVDGTTSSDK